MVSSGLQWSPVVPSGPLRPSASRRAALRYRVASQDKAGGPALEWFGFSGCGLLWTGSAGSGVFSVGSFGCGALFLVGGTALCSEKREDAL